MTEKIKKCSICGKEIKGWGNNPYPLDRGECCDECNNNVVIPLRLIFLPSNKNYTLTIYENGRLQVNKYVKEIPLKELQKMVDGYIELYPHKENGFYYLVDEDGISKERPFNYLAEELLNIEALGNVVVIPKNLLK